VRLTGPGGTAPAVTPLAGAEIVVYPTAIGSEPVFPDFDTRPLWQQVIVANGINSGLFMVVPNRVGAEGKVSLRFLVHLRPVRTSAGAGTPRPGGGAGG
jgi:predicted amidohydrolase